MADKQKILIVDDRPAGLFALQQVLIDVDAEIVEADSGEAALAAAQDHDFAVAILDVMMPEMDGYELAERLRGDERTRSIPVVFLTGLRTEQESEFEGYEAGCVDFIIKPYAPAVLVGKVKALLEMDRRRRGLQRHRDDLETLVAERTAALRDRVKEMRYLYALSSLVAEPCESLDQALQAAVELIPQGWRHPDVTCARVRFDGRQFATANFRDTAWKQSAEIIVSGQAVGTVEIGHLQELPAEAEGPFLNEESELIEDTARQLGILIRRKQAEVALERSEAQLSNALKIARAGHWEYDVPRDIFTFNDNFYRIFRTTAAEMGGYEVSSADYARKFCHPEDAHIVAKEVRAAIETDDPDYSCRVEHRILYSNGEVGHITVRFFIVKDSQGRTVKTYGVNQDVTERRQTEQERDRLQSQLLQSQKMEAVGRLAGGVAHDFNNLLMGIAGFAGFARDAAETGSQAHEDLTEVLALAGRAAALTRQLLAFSRRQTLAPVVLSLNGLIGEQANMLTRLLGEDIELRFLPAPDLGSVRADPGQIEQVVMNLAVNARDAMPDGGCLTIETANVELGEEHAREHEGAAPGPYVMLAVGDSGRGMDEATRAQLFEPFFTTKELGKGTGLGLSTVYGIVKQHGGHIWVYSEPGKGTIFKIHLPRVGADEGEPVPASGSIGGGTETILLVEDSDAVRDVGRRHLEALGYAVLCAAGPREAEQVAQGHEGRIDLLLTDVVMPDRSGRELYESMVVHRRRLRVLYMSGYTDDAIGHRGVLEEGVSFLQKPFEGEALAAKVRQALEA